MKRTPEEERIFQALSSIQTPPAPLEAGIHARLAARRPPRRPYVRMALVCACLLAVLGAAAAAVGLTDAWRYFFSSPIPSSAVTELGLSQTKGEYTLTLEDAVAEDTGVLLLLSLTRADGGVIDPAVGLNLSSLRRAPSLSLSNGTSLSLHAVSPPQQSTDQKALYYVLQASTDDQAASLAGETLTLDLFALGTTPYNKTAVLSLAELSAEHWDTYFPSDFSGISAALSRQNAALPVPAVDGFSGAVLHGAVMLEEKGLSIGISAPDMGVQNNILCDKVYPNAIVDTRTGARYYHGSMRRYELENGEGSYVYSFQDCPLTPEDLPWLELEVVYACTPLVPDSSFSIPFQVDTVTSISVPLDGLELAGQTLPIHTLQVTPLGISLIGAGNDLTPYECLYQDTQIPCSLTKTDGTVLSLECTGGYVSEFAGESCCVLSLSRPLCSDSAFTFWDPGEIASIAIGDCVLPVA